MKLSLKHLFRAPVKTLLFFLLMTGCTLLLVFGSVMFAVSNQRIQAAEDSFQTIGTIEQPPLSTKTEISEDPCRGNIVRTYDRYGETIFAEDLDFPGANYLFPPENRPYYIAHLPEISPLDPSNYGQHIVEFVPKEDCESIRPVEVEITKVLSTNYGDDTIVGGTAKALREGDIIQFCQCARSEAIPIYAGKTYVASVMFFPCETHGVDEYFLSIAPHSTQYRFDSREWQGEYFPKDSRRYLSEVTDDFYDEGGHGQEWLFWADFYNGARDHYFYVLPTNSLKLLPSYHQGLLYTESGREISEEEFETGAPVCMIPHSMLVKNHLSLGDKINLPLLASVYGLPEEDVILGTALGNFSLLDRNGKPYEPFWEQEYEIVGTYKLTNEHSIGAGEIGLDQFLIPAKSVRASDENNIVHYLPMNRVCASFQIPNGSIEEFDKALREAVPAVEHLIITYDDMGYAKVMKTLQTARNTAILLCVIGALAAVAILILLLYFFIVKQKKRTAIERGMGMTKRQCRASLVAGLLALTIAACALGSCGAAVVTGFARPAAAEETLDTEEFNTAYSLWAKKANVQEELEAEAEPPLLAYLAAPLLQCFAVLALSLLLAGRNLKTKPIELLSTKEE